jgi:DNA invertase Pin-like site-specific DNA recombinase
MSYEAAQKVTARHLRRQAYLYVRQSSLRQVLENTESTQRQYALRQRAVALGWPCESIEVIDDDQGQSGASTADRHGFQRLVTEVGLGRAGIVMGLEVSRLARNSSDWHRLLEICALTDTLILDEDGIYDPAHFNDRLLLGLKGTMSEAELHVLKARLIGGILSKARRGELRSPLPVGLVYDVQGRVGLDPDQQVQNALRLFFATFQRTGTATATVKAFRCQGISFPRRLQHGPKKGEVLWGDLTHSRALDVLHNPRYAGAFFWGRTRQRHHPNGYQIWHSVPREEWTALIPDAHPGYLSWEQFEDNQRRLRETCQAYGLERRRSPPREGPALLQGLVICGRCGRRMTVHYYQQKGRPHPEYVCQKEGIERAQSSCQRIIGAGIDAAVSRLLVEAVSPMTLEVALAVQQELEQRIVEADRARNQQVERARYEAELAQRRYMKVDPDNRLVAASLEAEWNERLRALQTAQENYERQTKADRLVLDDEQRAHILALATDFPRLWNDPQTPQRERKRMVRLLLEDVTLTKNQQITVAIRFRGGATQILTLPPPLPAWKLRQTESAVVAEIDRLLDQHTDREIAQLLDERGYRSGEGRHLHRLLIRNIRQAYRLKSRQDRLCEAGLLSADELAQRLGVTRGTVKVWRRAGLLRSHRVDDKGQYLYEEPGADAPIPYQHKGVARALRERKAQPHRMDEV